MRDGPVRRAVKRLALWRYQIDLAFTRWVLARRGEPAFDLRGRCTGCGACCESPMVSVLPPCFHLKSVRWLILTWHRVVNGFVHVGDDRPTHTFIFRCTHYDPRTRRCDSYDSRPGMCRDYPRNLLHSPAPEFLPKCGFYALHRDAERIRASLRELQLPPDQQRAVEARFYVWEPPERDEPPAPGNQDRPAA